MKDINSVFLIGRLTKDIQEGMLRHIGANNTAVLDISIGVSESVKQNEQYVDKPNFFDITVWGKLAEFVAKYATKGQQLGISGRLQQQTWQDKTTGQNRSKVVIVAEEIQLLRRPGDGNQQNDQPPQGVQQITNDDGFTEDVPF